MPTEDPWSKGSEILTLKTGNNNLDSMQVKKETLRVVPLGVGSGDLPVDGPRVRMMPDLYFNFTAKIRKYSLDSLY